MGFRPQRGRRYAPPGFNVMKLFLRFISVSSIFVITSTFILLVQNSTTRVSPQTAINFIGYWGLNQSLSIKQHPYSFVLDKDYIQRINFYQDSSLTRIFTSISTLFGVQPRAFTWGQHIFLTKEVSMVDVPLIAHELVHAAQYRKEGIIALDTKYLWYFFTRGYREIPYEKDAYEFQVLVADAILQKD